MLRENPMGKMDSDTITWTKKYHPIVANEYRRFFLLQNTLIMMSKIRSGCCMGNGRGIKCIGTSADQIPDLPEKHVFKVIRSQKRCQALDTFTKQTQISFASIAQGKCEPKIYINNGCNRLDMQVQIYIESSNV